MTTQPWTLVCGDGIAGLREYGRVDVVITDPPYTEHVNDHARASPKRVRGRQKIVEREFGFEAISPESLEAAAAAIAYNCRRWAIVFCAHDQVEEWREALERHGMSDPKRTLIWHKSNSTPQLTGDRPAFNYECAVIMHAKDTPMRWNGGGLGSVFNGPIDESHKQSKRKDSNDRHPTAKPLWLMRRLVELFTEPGEMIADPFAGGATTLVAAVVEGRRAVGWEIDRKNYNIGMRRLADPGTVPLEGPSIELPFAEPSAPSAEECPACGSIDPPDVEAELSERLDPSADFNPPHPDDLTDWTTAEVAQEFAPWPDEKIGPECFGGSDGDDFKDDDEAIPF